ncbi:phage head-tail connector protein [Paraburkholderia phymatum]|uniref:Phage protein n=1 Tax=Paraburkholderia phymatum (strain DSM 17167 / CIP 108236 / LMG 21445 / STM815) TaxID=391038 RepID=B2JU94_PARP8|nr:phage head-tail connector protein [Paraburkholderia phymatum]ACC76147.1 hypothetical protein Bphy_7146 [Paraburkholderia phymatum STM815]
MSSEILIRPPAGEPVSLAEAKQHLRVTDSLQDSLISMLISNARIACESKTRRQLLHARWQLVTDRFPMSGVGTPLPFCDDINLPAYAIRLPHAPFVDLQSVTYFDMSSTLQTMDPATYTVNSAMEPALVSPRFRQIWPIPLPQIGAVQWTYDAGYASPIKNAVAGSAFFTVVGPVSWKVGDTTTFYNSGGALPAPLQPNTPYLIAQAVGNEYSVSDMDGNTITLTDGGSGASFIGTVPEGLRHWILLRVGSLYENREEVAILNRGKVEELPFVDGLLDPYRISMP